MQYAVIRSGGKQYRVKKGDVVEVDKLNTDSKKAVVFDEVLLTVDEGKVFLGNPLVKGAKVEAKLLDQKKGEKIRVIKYKAKVRYRRAVGFRPQLTVVEIEKINLGRSTSVKKAEKPAKSK